MFIILKEFNGYGLEKDKDRYVIKCQDIVYKGRL